MKYLIMTVLLGMSTLVCAHQYHTHSDDDSHKPQQDNIYLKEAVHLLQQARRDSDETKYLQAEKILNKISRQTTQVKIYLAEIQQYFHRFDEALYTLQGIRHNTSAELLRAGIYFTQGKFSQAHAECKTLFGRADTLLAMTCTAHANSLQGELVKAYEVLEAAITHVPTKSQQAKAWALVTLAEMSERNDDAVKAKHFYSSALALNPNDLPSRIAYADILLLERDYAKTIELTKNFKSHDLLALRYIRALAHQDFNASKKEFTILKNRIENYSQEKRHLHFDLLAEYHLYFRQDPIKALYWAKRHWQQQKTPRDARLLAQLSIVAEDNTAINELKKWQQGFRLQDKKLEVLLRNSAI